MIISPLLMRSGETHCDDGTCLKAVLLFQEIRQLEDYNETGIRQVPRRPPGSVHMCQKMRREYDRRVRKNAGREFACKQEKRITLVQPLGMIMTGCKVFQSAKMHMQQGGRVPRRGLKIEGAGVLESSICRHEAGRACRINCNVATPC